MADAQEGKPSRYRSQRKAPATATSQPATDTGLGRSRSRYHHNRPAATQQQQQQQDQSAPESTDEHAIRPTRTRSTRGRDQSRDTQAGATADSGSDRYGSTRSHHKSLEQSKSSERPADPMEYAMSQAPTMIRAKAEAYIPPIQDGDVSEEDTAGCFGIFNKKKTKRRRKERALQQAAPRPVVNKPAESAAIRPGGRGIVPMTDAPLSAPNVQGRRVRVECGSKHIDLPVSSTTSASDLIASAATCLSENIDLHTSILLEFYHPVGITRPIRRYEHVKDVMNSWDDDTANSLQIVPANAINVNPAGLSAANAPRSALGESSFLLHHSSKPNDWHKRLITIHSDGQIVMSKPNKENSLQNIAHLTDFDIYSPTARQLSKKIKPPGKICYALKSQTKSSMFLEESTYVHFFSTSEQTLATSFYEAIQAWRSWYLVNVLDEGKKKSKPADLGRSTSTANRQSKQSSHAQQPSTGSMDAHYQLGTYKPLMDLEQSNRPNSSRGQDVAPGAPTGLSTSNAPARKPSVRERSSHPSALSKQQQLGDDEPLVKLAGNRRASLDQGAAESEAFSGDGLLGRSYSTRQKMVSEREAAAKNPWVTGPSLLSGDQAEGLDRHGSVKRTASTRRNNPSSLSHRPSTRERLMAADDGLKRSGSTRTKDQKPLLDFTPGYVPPPQHLKKGKGFHPDQVGPGGLIDNATSPEQAYHIPPSHDWRAARAQPAPAPATAGVSRQRSLAHRPGPETTDEAFTGGGLLNGARAGYSGKPSVGRGVMSGDRNARAPMLNVSEESGYAPGSLLNQVARHEREEGRGGPIIDRSR